MQGHSGDENHKLLFAEHLPYARHHTMYFVNITLFKSLQGRYYLYLTDEKKNDAQWA